MYKQDFKRWREVVIKQIKAKNFQAIDWENLMVELEDMSQAEKRAFVSNLTILMAHLLKLMIQKDLQENTSFQSYLAETINKSYKHARKLAIKEGQKADFAVRKPSAA